ncbi:MAG: FecR family protein, partial [Bacteroidaceae bacterium]
KFPGEEKKIEAAIAMIKHSTINKDKSLYSRPYKMRNLSRIFDKNNEQQKQLKRKRVYKYIVGVAAVLILCVLPAYYLLFYTSTSLNDEFAMIEPCANDTSGQVQIFMGDEQSISLDKTNPNITVEKDGSISVDNVQVAKVDNEKLTTNQIVVPYGKRSRITLPDGSLLWINSGSRIAYKSDFSTNRKLTISGEIYLDVKRDVHHPFIVKSSRMEVEVLGTAFNVSDY